MRQLIISLCNISYFLWGTGKAQPCNHIFFDLRYSTSNPSLGHILQNKEFIQEESFIANMARYIFCAVLTNLVKIWLLKSTFSDEGKINLIDTRIYIWVELDHFYLNGILVNIVKLKCGPPANIQFDIQAKQLFLKRLSYLSSVVIRPKKKQLLFPVPVCITFEERIKRIILYFIEFDIFGTTIICFSMKADLFCPLF